MKDVSGREIRFSGDEMVAYLRYLMRANSMAYAMRMARLRREASGRHAHLQRQLDHAEAEWEQAKQQIPGWYGREFTK